MHIQCTCLSQLIDMALNSAAKDCNTGLILFDLPQVFHINDLEILLVKVKCVGFYEKVIEWLDLYYLLFILLASLDSYFSDAATIEYGVRQGSI